jgi:type VI secretion system protein ImpF
MARWEAEQTVTQSVLDRLIDREPSVPAEPAPTRAQSVRQLRAALRRDLEWLLNTRRNPEAAGPEFVELERSLFNYGLPDISSLHWNSSRDRTRLSHLLEAAVAYFEPRLERVKVIALDAAGGGSIQVLRFQIEGMLKMDPAPEHISFDTVLQISSGEYQVKGDSSAG